MKQCPYYKPGSINFFASCRELAETIDEVFWVTDPAKKQMLYISPGYERIWGRSCERAWMAFVRSRI